MKGKQTALTIRPESMGQMFRTDCMCLVITKLQEEVNKSVKELLFCSKNPLRMKRIWDCVFFPSISSYSPLWNHISLLLLWSAQEPNNWMLCFQSPCFHICAKTAAQIAVPQTRRKIGFQKTIVLSLTMRYTLEITHIKVCPLTECKGRVHLTGVKARILYVHWTQNQLQRITERNLNCRWTQKYWHSAWADLNWDQTSGFQCP